MICVGPYDLAHLEWRHVEVTEVAAAVDFAPRCRLAMVETSLP